MSQKKLFKMIDEMRGEDGWWKDGGRVTFRRLGKELMQKGYTCDEAFDFLESAYYVGAGEYGG